MSKEILEEKKIAVKAAQAEYIKHAKSLEANYDKVKLVKERMEVLASIIGVGPMFQDTETKCVYQVIEPEGQFVTYKKSDYKRTNKVDENRGSAALAKKTATEAGFTL